MRWFTLRHTTTMTRNLSKWTTVDVKVVITNSTSTTMGKKPAKVILKSQKMYWKPPCHGISIRDDKQTTCEYQIVLLSQTSVWSLFTYGLTTCQLSYLKTKIKYKVYHHFNFKWSLWTISFLHVCVYTTSFSVWSFIDLLDRFTLDVRSRCQSRGRPLVRCYHWTWPDQMAGRLYMLRIRWLSSLSQHVILSPPTLSRQFSRKVHCPKLQKH